MKILTTCDSYRGEKEEIRPAMGVVIMETVGQILAQNIVTGQLLFSTLDHADVTSVGSSIG